MKFKARVIRPIESTPAQFPLELTTLFTRNWIVEIIDDKTGKRWPNEHDKSKVLTTYTFDKIRDKDDKRQFQITYPNSATATLKMGWFNKFKCNWVHRRYIINKDEGEWFIKTIITTLIAAMVSLMSLWIGYRQGHQAGLKEVQSQSQDTTHKR
ncbi:MAG: hypothetical protein V4557_14465 [Bacteroidota bacterium]